MGLAGNRIYPGLKKKSLYQIQRESWDQYRERLASAYLDGPSLSGRPGKLRVRLHGAGANLS